MDSKLSTHAGADDVGLLASWRSDGTGLLTATALGLLAAGLFAWFLATVGVHGLIGYLDLSHFGPAILGAGVFVAGIVLSRPSFAARPAG